MEDLKISRRNLLKVGSLLFIGMAGITIYINSNHISIDEAIKISLNKLNITLNDIEKEIPTIIDKNIDIWAKQTLDKNIENFLDWYYSMGGELAILVYAALEKGIDIFKNEYLREKYEEFKRGFTEKLFEGILDKTIKDIKSLYYQKFETYKLEITEIFKNVDKIDISKIKNLLNNLEKRTLIRVSVSLSISLSFFAFLTRRLIGKLTRIFIKKVGKKVALRFGMGRFFSLIGLACANFAILCIGALNVAFDAVFRKLDEFLNRDELKKEIKTLILTYLPQIKEDIKKGVLSKVKSINRETFLLARKEFMKIYPYEIIRDKN